MYWTGSCAEGYLYRALPVTDVMELHLVKLEWLSLTLESGGYQGCKPTAHLLNWLAWLQSFV